MTPAAIRALRIRLGLKQPEFAALLGVKSTYVSEIENAKHQPGPTLINLLRMVDAHGPDVISGPNG